MDDNSTQSTFTFEPIFNIRLTRMPGCPQPSDKLYESDGVMFRLSERFVYKPRLHAGSEWKLYDGVTIPRKEDLILVGNPDERTSKLVYILADQAEYRMLDFSEIPFVTLANTRNITSTPACMDFGKQNNDFQFTFEVVTASTRSQIRRRSNISTPSPSRLQRQTEPYSAIASPVAACIGAVTSYFTSTSLSGNTAQKRSREIAFKEGQETEANRRQCRRFGSPYTSQWYRILTTSIGCQ